MGREDVTWQRLISKYEAKDDKYLDPAVWCKDMLGEHLWSMQADIGRSVRDNRFTTVRACHASGKSHLASRIAAWWVATNPPEDLFVVTTAPTARQVAAILWRYITRVHNLAKSRGNPLPGQILSSPIPSWKVDGELIGYGSKPADYQESAFQGIHARKVLVIVDEAAGIAKNLWDAVDALVTNESGRVLAIGNPTDPGSHFRAICDENDKAGQKWTKFHIDALRSPLMTEEGCRKFPLLYDYMIEEGIPFSTETVPEIMQETLVSPQWVAEALTSWGKDSSLFQSRVRGIFPSTNDGGIIPLGWVQQAVYRHERWKEGAYTLRADGTKNYTRSPQEELVGMLTLGVDVSDGGDDMSAIAIRQGPVIKEIKRHVPKEAYQVAAIATMEAAEQGASGYNDVLYVVDGNGAGSGVVSKLREDGKQVISFIASAQSGRRDKTGKMGFLNDRTAAWYNLRELLNPNQPGGSKICLPDDSQMIADLVAPKYWEQPGTPKYVLEPKKDIKKRIGRSTDLGDAVVQAFWYSGAPIDPDLLKPGQIRWPDATTKTDPHDPDPVEPLETDWVEPPPELETYFPNRW